MPLLNVVFIIFTVLTTGPDSRIDDFIIKQGDQYSLTNYGIMQFGFGIIALLTVPINVFLIGYSLKFQINKI